MSRISVMTMFHINIADLTLPIWWLNLFENVLFCCVYCQAAMMLFELAWMLTKDTKDMLW